MTLTFNMPHAIHHFMKYFILTITLLCLLIMNSCQTYDNPGENVDIIVRESSPYKRLIKKCKHVESSTCSIMAYILNCSNYLVVVFGDAMGTVYYTAYCYELSNDDYLLLSKITYSSRGDFSEPTLVDNIYSVRSKKNNKLIVFDVTKGGEYHED